MVGFGLGLTRQKYNLQTVINWSHGYCWVGGGFWKGIGIEKGCFSLIVAIQTYLRVHEWKKRARERERDDVLDN